MSLINAIVETMVRQLLDAGQVASILGVRKHRVYDLIRQGVLPRVQMGHQVRVDAAKLETWIENGGRGPENRH